MNQLTPSARLNCPPATMARSIKGAMFSMERNGRDGFIAWRAWRVVDDF